VPFLVRRLLIPVSVVSAVIDVLKEEAERKKNGRQEEDGAGGDKSEWMSTAQLWTGGSGRGAAEPEVRSDSAAQLSCSNACSGWDFDARMWGSSAVVA
jgi:hypothetical protein